MKGIIYKATNTLNGKVYVGQTVSGLARRKAQHYKDARTDAANLFHFALYQYPVSFEWEVVDTFQGSREQVIHALNVAEEYHILKNRSTDERYGYNSTFGGYSSDKFTDRIKERAKAFGGSAKQILQYDREGNFIREFSSLNEVGAYLNKGKMRASNLIAGLHYGYQWRIKTNNHFPLKIGPYARPHKHTSIAVYDNEGLLAGKYDSFAQALEATGQKSAKIRGDIENLVIKEYYARDFYFFRLNDEIAPDRINISIQRKRRKEAKPPQSIPVIAYDAKTGLFVKEYPSMAVARKSTGVARATINHYLLQTEPYKVGLPQTKYIWVRNTGTIKPSITVIRFTRQEPKPKYIMEHRIIQYSLQGEFIKVWENAHKASESTPDNYSAIYNSLKGKQGKKTHYIWQYYSDDFPQQLPQAGTSPKKENKALKRSKDTIAEINKAGETIAVYNDTAEAAEQSGFSQSYICNVLAGRIKHPKRRFKRL